MPSISEIEKFDIGELSKNYNNPLNAFFLYRREFTKRAIASGMKIKMTEISKMASKSWKNEPRKVKNNYMKVSRKVDDLLHLQRKSRARL